MGLQYKILYKKGTKNRAADALSRRRHPEQIMAISSIKHQWLDVVVLSYQAGSDAMKLLSELATKPDSIPQYSLVQGVIRYWGRIWLGSSKAIQQQVLTTFHASPWGGSLGSASNLFQTETSVLLDWHESRCLANGAVLFSLLTS
jgi:hypothetical protein